MADCTTGRVSGEQLQGVSFYEGGESVTKSTAERVLYFYDADTQKLMRRVGNGDAESIVSSGILITNARFYVTGSQKMSDVGQILNNRPSRFI
jgi:hypothetical protein